MQTESEEGHSGVASAKFGTPEQTKSLEDSKELSGSKEEGSFET
jgi:hypothetical protein